MMKRHLKKRLKEAYKKQIVRDVLKLSRTEIFTEAMNIPPLKPSARFFPNGNESDAVIGRGMWLNQHLYQEGYIGTAIRLLDLIKMSNSNTIKDSYIIVSLFCFRHYLELTMKDSLVNYYKDDAPSVIMDSGHRLLALFQELMKLPHVFPDSETEAIKNMIVALHECDPTGVVFRYPYSANESTGTIQSTLRQLNGLRSVGALRRNMLRLYNFFDGINSMVHNYERNGIFYNKNRLTNKSQSL